MTRILVTLFIVFAFVSCRQEEAKNVLNPQQMKDVLWDIMRADEMMDFYAEKDSSLARLDQYTGNYQQIFHIHHTTKDIFKKSLKYYEGKPEEFKIVLDSIQTMAERAQRQVEASQYMKPAQGALPMMDSAVMPARNMLDSLRKKRAVQGKR